MNFWRFHNETTPRNIPLRKAYNYKTTKVEDALADGAPDGVDCFFDNIGGRDAAVIINHMNEFGRISVCGAIASYNKDQAEDVPATSFTFVVKV